MNRDTAEPGAGLLGDSVDRDYADKLTVFEAFAEPELKHMISDLGIEPGSAILDLGCGTGRAMCLLNAEDRRVIGIDLSHSHACAAAGAAPAAAAVVSDARCLPFPKRVFDLIWSCNTVNHLSAPVSVLRRLGEHLKPGGRIAVAQSHFVPEMFFAWDYHLDARVRSGCHAYYREKYGLLESETTGVTRLFGAVKDAGFVEVHPKTYILERHYPLSSMDRKYMESFFRNYWGPKLQPFLNENDRLKLQKLCNPDSPDFCLDRRDFHHIQTITMVVGHCH